MSLMPPSIVCPDHRCSGLANDAATYTLGGSCTERTVGSTTLIPSFAEINGTQSAFESGIRGSSSRSLAGSSSQVTRCEVVRRERGREHVSRADRKDLRVEMADTPSTSPFALNTSAPSAPAFMYDTRRSNAAEDRLDRRFEIVLVREARASQRFATRMSSSAMDQLGHLIQAERVLRVYHRDAELRRLVLPRPCRTPPHRPRLLGEPRCRGPRRASADAADSAACRRQTRYGAVEGYH